MISFLQLLKETQSQKILVPRRSPEERAKNHIIAINRQIQEYIKNGSKGDLDLENTPITQLPSNLTVGGSLYLINSKITQLPNNLKVRGSLNLRNTPITQLPDNLTVKGHLNLYNTQITQLPNNLEVGGYIYINDDKKQYFKDKYPQYADKIL